MEIREFEARQKAVRKKRKIRAKVQKLSRKRNRKAKMITNRYETDDREVEYYRK